MKNILLPTDFSKNAWNAICYSLQFFKDETCTFFLLHTYTPVFYRLDYLMGGPEFSVIPDVGVDISLAGLEKTLADIKEQFPNDKHQYEVLSAFNTLTDEIKEVCRRKNIDLIVMGTQGATGAKEIFLGTNTVHVIRQAKVPVLAVPEHSGFTEIKSILFPVDYWTHYHERELQLLVDITEMHRAKLIVMHVKEEYDLTAEQKENQKFLADYFDTLNHAFEEMKGSLMPNAIPEFIAQHHLDLLAMMNRKHSFLERLLLRQNVDVIGYHTKIPFLVIPDTAEISK